MSQQEIIKICKHHGPLTIEQVNKNKSRGASLYRCKACQKEAHEKHWEKHKEIVKEKQRMYRENNREKVRECRRISRKKNLHKYPREYLNQLGRNSYYRNYTERRKRENLRKMKCRILLTDGYIRRLITRRNKVLGAEDVPEGIVSLKKTLMLIKRKIKNKSYDEKLNRILTELGEKHEQKDNQH